MKQLYFRESSFRNSKSKVERQAGLIGQITLIKAAGRPDRANDLAYRQTVRIHFTLIYFRCSPTMSRFAGTVQDLPVQDQQWRNSINTHLHCLPMQTANTPQLPRKLSQNSDSCFTPFPHCEESRRRRRRSFATICSAAARKRIFVWRRGEEFERLFCSF